MNKPSLLTRIVAAILGLAFAGHTQNATAADLTWSGGSGNNWSTPSNWSPSQAPVTSDTLTFSGATNTTSVNDIGGLTLANATNTTAFTFLSGAGAFVVSGSSITAGTSTANTNVVYQQSASNVEIRNNLTFAGNQRDRNIGFTAGTGTVTLSGNINFGSDIISLARNSGTSTIAGTLVLSGSNSGDGKNNQIQSGGNVMRAMLWTGTAGSRVVIGSDNALGNAGSGSADAGTAVLKGILAGQQLFISTANGARNLSNSTFGITNRIEFDGANNLTIGNVINSSGNRDLWVTGAGTLTVATGLFLSNDTTGRNLFFNVTGAGEAVVNGKIYDTFSNTGGTYATMTSLGTLRKAGSGTLTLNGSSSYLAITNVEGGTLKLGSANALGSSGSASFTSIRGGTLDLNGQTIAEKLWSDAGSNTISNGSATAAAVTTDIGLSNDLTFNTTGDVTVPRLIATAVRTITKESAGTLTTSGTGANNLTAWVINNGRVVFANTSGLAADRGVTINSGTLQLAGANSNLVNDGQSFTMNGGVFDLNGKGETVAAIAGTGGSVRNGAAATTATLTVGGSSSGTFAGVFENGAGTLAVVKAGSGIQTLTGTSTYTGSTNVDAGSLIVNGVLGATATTVSGSALLGGSGSIGGLVSVSGTLSPGNSPGVITLASLTLNPAATTLIEIAGTGRGSAYDGIDITTSGGLTYGGTLAFDFSSLFADNATFDIFSFTGSSAGSFTSVVSTGSYAGTWTNNNNGTFSLAKDSQTLTFSQSTGDVIIVPEPTALILVAMGAVAWAAAHRRRSIPAPQRRER